MSIISKIKQDISEFSNWFRVSVIILFIIYILFWVFSISLNKTQISNNFNPVLPVLSGDSEEYHKLSESMISGNGFGMDGVIETLRTPGYPLFISVLKVIGRSYFAATLVQILLVFVSAYIIRKIGIFFVSKKVGEISAFLFLINPVTLVLSLIILSDTLFLFLFTLGFYLAISMTNEKLILKIFTISAIFTFAIFVRPIGFFAFPIFIAPIFVSKIDFRTKWKLAVVLVVFMIAFLSPWIIRNYVNTDIASFTNIVDFNLVWTSTKFLSNINRTSIESEYSAFEKSSGVPSYLWRDMRYSKAISKTAEEIILSQPFSYIKYHMISSLPFLFPSSVSFAIENYNSALHTSSQPKLGSITLLVSGDLKSFIRGIFESWWKVLERLGWLFVYIVSIFSIWKYKKSFLTWSFVLIIGYLMVLSGPASGPRYSFQAWPFIFILFSSGIVYLSERFNKPKLQ